MSGVVVVGSANLDRFARVTAIPRPGETVLATGVEIRAGGKGLNQAVAAARAGARTNFVGAVGSDDAGDLLRDEAVAAGVDCGLLRRVDGPSGTACITVQEDGENAIVVDGAANATVTGLTVDERAAIGAASVLVTQLETPLSAVTEAARVARDADTRVVLNAAPAQPLDRDLLDLVDVLVVNEHEATTLSGEAGPEVAAGALHRPGHAVAVTLGAEGVLLVDDDGVRRVAGARADVVDTTGAGDTFTGYLAAGLADGLALDAAAARAVVAGALTVERPGAVPSIPTAAEVDDRLGAS